MMNNFTNLQPWKQSTTSRETIIMSDGWLRDWKKREDDSLLRVNVFRIGAWWHFWWKVAIVLQHFITTEALLPLLGLRHHWSTSSSEEIIADTRVEAVHGEGRCQRLPCVDSMIQLVISAGLDFSVIRHQKIPKNMKYWYGSMISWRHHDLTDAILKFHVCRGRFIIFLLLYLTKSIALLCIDSWKL